MKRIFSKKLLGFKKDEVLRYIEDLKKDYEEQLSKKQDRMLELCEDNRRMRAQILEMEEKISLYANQEAYISRALVKAEQKAQSIVEESYRKSADEMHSLEIERNKWRERYRQIRTDIIGIEKNVCDIMERFRSEINYLASKELSESILEEETQQEKKPAILNSSKTA